MIKLTNFQKRILRYDGLFPRRNGYRFNQRNLDA